MNPKIRRFALVMPVVIALLVTAVVVFSVVTTSASSTNGSLYSADVSANPDVAVEKMSCEFSHFVGKTVNEVENAILELGHKIRVLGPNTPATMDYRPDRVNVLHDEEGLVIQVTCG